VLLYNNNNKQEGNMKLLQIGSNQTEITTARGNRVLYSYETPVAAWTEQGAFRTSTKFSVTTSKHINKYLGGKDVGRAVDQTWLEGLVN
jgi:phage terminase large subunit-like protein